MPVDFPQGLQLVSTAVAILGGGAALFSRLPDRRRQRFREQYQTLASLVARGDEPQHDLLLESGFRAAFEASAPVPVVRFFVDNRFPLIAVEQYCAVREYLGWSDAHSTFWSCPALVERWRLADQASASGAVTGDAT